MVLPLEETFAFFCVGTAQAHIPAAKNCLVEIHRSAFVGAYNHRECNGLLPPRTTALLITVEPQAGKYACELREAGYIFSPGAHKLFSREVVGASVKGAPTGGI